MTIEPPPDEIILEFVRRSGPVRTREIVKECRIPRRSAMRYLHALARQGKLQRTVISREAKDATPHAYLWHEP